MEDKPVYSYCEKCKETHRDRSADKLEARIHDLEVLTAHICKAYKLLKNAIDKLPKQ